MKALVTRAHATAPVLADVPPAPLGSTDVRITVAAAAVNPIDSLLLTEGVRAGVFGLPPEIGLGWDLSGTVIEIGPDVTRFAIGDRVAALDNNLAAPSRAHAEQIVVPASATAHVPDGLDLEAAASIPLNAATALQALALLGEPAGRSLLVTGGAGAVGGYAVELAARAGWQVTALARPTDDEFVRTVGATRLLTKLPGPDFDAVLDAAVLQQEAVGAVHDGGVVVSVSGIPLVAERGITLTRVGVKPDGTELATLLAASATGDLTVRVTGTVPLDQAAAAYAKVAAGGQRGRWLLIP